MVPLLNCKYSEYMGRKGCPNHILQRALFLVHWSSLSICHSQIGSFCEKGRTLNDLESGERLTESVKCIVDRSHLDREAHLRKGE